MNSSNTDPRNSLHRGSLSAMDFRKGELPDDYEPLM